MKKRTSSMWLQVCLVFLGLSAVIFLSGCGGSKPDAVWNIAGGWYVYHDATGTPGEQGPDLFTFTQSVNDLSGTTAAGEPFSGTISGTDVSFSWTASDGTSYSYSGTASNGNMAGTWSGSNGQSGTWHAVFASAPSLSVAGSWNVFQTVAGSTEQGPAIFTLEQSGNSISGTASQGETVTGSIGSTTNNLIFTWNAGNGTTYVYTGTATDNSHMSGSWTSPEGQSGTWRATRN